MGGGQRARQTVRGGEGRAERPTDRQTEISGKQTNGQIEQKTAVDKETAEDRRAAAGPDGDNDDDDNNDGDDDNDDDDHDDDDDVVNDDDKNDKTVVVRMRLKVVFTGWFLCRELTRTLSLEPGNTRIL